MSTQKHVINVQYLYDNKKLCVLPSNYKMNLKFVFFSVSRTCDISSMGKMIVTIGGGSENKEASVSSGKLLIEVRDERSSRDPGKPRRSKLKKFRENDTDEEAFDPDTLERGLGGGGGPKHSQVRCLGQGEG